MFDPNSDHGVPPECLALLGQETAPKGEDEHSSFNQILSIKAVHFLAFFIFVYVGVEVTIGGTLFRSYLFSSFAFLLT